MRRCDHAWREIGTFRQSTARGQDFGALLGCDRCGATGRRYDRLTHARPFADGGELRREQERERATAQDTVAAWRRGLDAARQRAGAGEERR